MKTKMNQKYVIIGFVFIIAGIIVNTFFNRGVSIQGDGNVSKEEAAGFLSTLVEEVVYVYEKPSEVFQTQTEKMKIGEEEVEVTVLTYQSPLPTPICVRASELHSTTCNKRI